MVSILWIFDGVEDVRSLELDFGSSFVVLLDDKWIHVDVFEALDLATLTHLSLLNHGLLLLLRRLQGMAVLFRHFERRAQFVFLRWTT